ncbi:MAG: T9SS type A sorting domain-containing protein [Saprospiraceae bacterium]|jgi:hypothetical protein|nr:T9SS type A sorting domain-containing protein [Saprospiraceae bacterium]MBK9378840.1 T9SS type A sorting domain-containing protein [Saprospiraceae bacterium]MBL0262194.1 T9SS type A sorting domain-containing protein [Saprospiraceae bacterium]MBX7163202.1 T9SS type A sorting domain-containing protein [Saprospiraceae bacterium]
MNRIYIIILSLLFFGTIDAQNLLPIVVNSSGGVIRNSSNSLEWSLGEVAVSTITSSKNILTQGFLQPITTMVNTKNLGSEINLTHYPNPVENVLNIDTETQEIQSIKIYDLMGKLVLSSNFSKAIFLSNLHSGIYNVSLLNQHHQIITSFKINKI